MLLKIIIFTIGRAKIRVKVTVSFVNVECVANLGSVYFLRKLSALLK